MATSPSDQNKQNILTWLDRLQDSVRTAGRTGGSQAFNLDSRTRESTDGEEDSESEGEEVGETTERGSVGTVKLEEEDTGIFLQPHDDLLADDVRWDDWVAEDGDESEMKVETSS